MERDLWLRTLCRLKQLSEKANWSGPREKLSRKATSIFHGAYRCVCGSCLGGAMRDSSRTLRCVEFSEGGRCDRSRGTSSNFIDCEVLRAIRDTILSAADLPVYVEEYRRQMRRMNAEVSRQTEQHRRKIAEIDQWFAKGLDEVLTEGIPDEDKKAARARKDKERAEHRLALAALPLPAELPDFDAKRIVSLKSEVDELIRRLPIVAGLESDLLLVQTLRRLVGRIVVDRPNDQEGYSLEITFVPATLVAPAGASEATGLEPIVVRRMCQAPRATTLAAEERSAMVRARAERADFALTDEDWAIVGPILEGCLTVDERLVMDAALFYLRSDVGLIALPEPYGGQAMQHQVRRMVKKGSWRRAYTALCEFGSATVSDLDTSRFAGIERP